MKVLFVCTANICRSALAEVILKKMLQVSGVTGIEVESAGVRNLEGEPRDTTIAVCAYKAGYVMNGEARYISKDMTDSSDLIICMEHYHIVEIQKRLPYVLWNRIHLFNEICFDEKTDMPDPSGGTIDMYMNAFHRIEDGCRALVLKLSKTTE